VGLQALLTIAACSGHLAFALFAWRRRARNRVAPLLVLLFLDVAIWSLAELIGERTGAGAWRRMDRGFSSLMPALALHVVVTFVGRAKPLRVRVGISYACFSLIAGGTVSGVLPYRGWWRLLLGFGLAAMLYAASLLVAHARRNSDRRERARTRLLLAAVVVATLVSSTDLWATKVGLPIPRVSNVGMLAAMILLAVAALRLDLFGGERVTGTSVTALVASGFVGVLACLAAVQILGGVNALWVLGLLAAMSVASAALIELWRSGEAVNERSRRLAFLGRVSEQLAHDLKNPLGALKGSVQFLLTEHNQARSLDAHHEFLGLMLEQCERLARTVQDYQRLGSVEPLLARSSLNDIVRQVLALQSQGITPQIALTTSLDDTLPRCLLDRDLITRTLENLIRNAVEALPEGGQIEIRTEAGPTPAEAAKIQLAVRDDGPGIDPRILERVTEDFFSTKPGGSGLGLAFAARVAKAHGGELSIASQLGSGTRVTLVLPAAPRDDAPRRTPAS
jgi:two-component system, NtrC family, sensor histidine kinase HydH